MTKFNPNAIKRLTKSKKEKGLGEGELKNYKPWINVRDFASKGLVTRVKGIKTNRTHHLLSELELKCFLCLDWSDKVTDIREQYPLHQLETIAIADRLGIRHPKVPKTREHTVMTTDFLVNTHYSTNFLEVAISVKYSKDLEKKRVMEKLEIERYYWKRRNTGFQVVTEKQINSVLVRNIRYFHNYYYNDLSLPSIADKLIYDVSKYLFKRVISEHASLSELTNQCDEHFSLETGTSLGIVRHLVATKRWILDMNVPFQPERPICILQNQSEGGDAS